MKQSLRTLALASGILFCANFSLSAQLVDVEGPIKISAPINATTADSMLVILGDGTVAYRMLDSLVTMSISNDTLFLSNGVFIVLPPDQVDDADNDPTNEVETWSTLAGIPVNIDIDATDDFSGDYNDLINMPPDFADGDDVDDADNDPTNEIETWSTLAGIPADIADGDDVDDADNDPSNEIETWSTLAGIPADILDGDDVDDADNDPSNELQMIGISGDTVTLENGGYVVIEGISMLPALVNAFLQRNSVQVRLDLGETPIEIFNSGTPLDSLYGKTYLGGFIFHLDTVSGEGMVVSGNLSATAKWGCFPTDLAAVPNVTGSNPEGPGAEIGDGASNTDGIYSDCGQAGIAAKLARDHDDGVSWYLPSIKELVQIDLNLHNNGLGGLVNGVYWSSTERSNTDAWVRNFQFDLNQTGIKDSSTRRTRAVRSF